MWVFTAQTTSASTRQREVIVTTGGDDASHETGANSKDRALAPPGTLQDRLKADGLKAAEHLRKVVCGKNSLSPWAAVYLRHLEIAHDETCGKQALLAGTTAPSALLQALSWRHLITLKDTPLPNWSDSKQGDPTVAVLAAVAYAVRGAVPNSLRQALALPAGDPVGQDRKREVEKRANHLGALGIPFDNGPVALAAAFVEMRSRGCVVGKGKNAVFAAAVLRRTLLHALVGKPSRIGSLLPKTGKFPNGPGTFGDLLDNHLATRPAETLRAIILTGAPDLRIAALRAVVSIQTTPVAGDLAAAAAALSASDATVRLEAARTFLILLKRL